jgi:hypothetical protein
MASSEGNTGSLADLTSFLDVGRQILSLFDNILKAIENYRTFADKTKAKHQIDDLKFCLKEIRLRLFKRLNLIEKMRNFAEHGDEDEFVEIKSGLTSHTSFLRNFDEIVTKKIIPTDPKTAATLHQITENSIKLYMAFIEQKRVDDARILAGSFVSTMVAIASHLEIIEHRIDAYIKEINRNAP